jgi:hypothetical protein
MCHHFDRHWFTISIERLKLNLHDFRFQIQMWPRLNSDYTIPTFKFKWHFIRIQIQITLFKYFLLTFHPGHKKWKPSFINENINIYKSQFTGHTRPLISKIKSTTNSSTTFSWFWSFLLMPVYTILYRWTYIDYFIVEQIKERVRNELKIEETDSSEIELST